jgi:hypothetical protein
MVVEILAGIALVKSAVSGVKSMIDTAQDVNEISHHLEDLFKGHDQIRRKVAKSKQPKKGDKKWNDFLTSKFKDSAEDEGVSLSDITAEVIEQKQIEEQINAMKRMLNKRFGVNTWDEILDLRKKRIEEHKLQVAAQKEMDKIHEKESTEFWDKAWLWTWQSFTLVGIFIIFWYYLHWASKGKLPFIW